MENQVVELGTWNLDLGTVGILHPLDGPDAKQVKGLLDDLREKYKEDSEKLTPAKTVEDPE